MDSYKQFKTSKGFSIDHKNSIRDLVKAAYAEFGNEMVEALPSSTLPVLFGIINTKT